MTKPEDIKPDSGELRCSTFRVTGYAMVPVEVQIDVQAYDEAMAMQVADNLLTRKPALMRRHIVNGSEDETSVHSFKSSVAEKLNT